MLYPVAGSRFYIADLPGFPASEVPVGGWAEIGETEALGLLGGSWRTHETEIWDEDEEGELEVDKTLIVREQMQIILGNDPADAGQIILWRAFKSRDDFPFRIVFPGGTVIRVFTALVTGLHEVFDVANSVMKLQADLLPSSPVLRSEAD